MRRPAFALAATAAATLALTVTATAGSGGVTGPAFFVNGDLYRTVLTPTDVSKTGAPAHSFEPIYDFAMLQPNVATAAPGDPGYRGGRWTARPVIFNSSYADALAEHDIDDSGSIDTNAELAALFADPNAGGAVAGPVVAQFVCPVIKVPMSG